MPVKPTIDSHASTALNTVVLGRKFEVERDRNHKIDLDDR